MMPELEPEVICPRCEQRLPAAATRCHRCGLVLEPGVAYFDEGTTEVDPESVPVDERYERRQVPCMPMDLERVVRAEAVDGWTLLDTTVEAGRPGEIVAHFHRPARPSPVRKEKASPSRTQPVAAKQPKQAAASPARRVSSRTGEGPTEGDPREVLYWVILVMGMIFLINQLELIGLLIAIFVLPRLIRGMLGLPVRRGGKRRRE